MACSGLLALAELVIVTFIALVFLVLPRSGLFHVIVAFLLIALFVGSPSDPLWWVAAAITFLAVILFCIRKFMQG